MAEKATALDWDVTEAPEDQFILAPEGEHDFLVVDMERAYYEGSMKTPPCPMARVKLNLYTPVGEVEVWDTFPLATNMLWKVGALFASLGYQKNANGTYPIDWNGFIGKHGRLSIVHKTSSQGNTFANVDRYLKPGESKQPTTNAQAATAPTQQQWSM